MAHKPLQPALLALVLAVSGSFTGIAHSDTNADTAIVLASARDAAVIELPAVSRDMKTDFGLDDATPSNDPSSLSPLPGIDTPDWLDDMRRLFDRVEERTQRRFTYVTDHGVSWLGDMLDTLDRSDPMRPNRARSVDGRIAADRNGTS